MPAWVGMTTSIHPNLAQGKSRGRRLIALSLRVFAAALLVAAASSPTASASASKVGAAGGSLSGTWSGTYGGAYHGTFTLRWKQAGARLSGTIKLSNANSAPAITTIKGSVHGTAIRFGTVGSAAITDSGSVSGTSMAGSYQTPGGGGSWSAHKTS
ncbi:MAG TPA: hypothetical protein VG073_00245 [Gaiellaceae bacterium]|nr:hypothetical protein [Gaiellaceae bacterium]